MLHAGDPSADVTSSERAERFWKHLAEELTSVGLRGAGESSGKAAVGESD